MANAALGQDSLVGHVLGHYRIVEEIGAGGMGVVYRAHDEHLDRDIAIKILPSGMLGDTAARQRFHKEAHAVSKLNHPNIASVYDFDSCDGIDYLAEELVPGISLEEMLSSGPLGEKELVNLGTQLCEGLVAAHNRGVLHRDIKPSNLRVTPEGQLKIIDFGLAKIVAIAGLAADEQATLSETQIPAGTLPYMSPEQLRNEKLDARSDIWAAGCVLYEMATGRRPFLGRGTAVVEEILHQALAPPSKLNHKISPSLEVIIEKCLEKDAALRYGSAHEIAVDLRRLSAGAALVPTVRRRRSGLYWAWLLAALIFLVLIAGAGWKLRLHSSTMQNKSIAVLSFRNMSGDQSLNWLDSGLAELLTTNLSQVKGMDVLSREQIFRAIKRKGQQNAPELPPEVALDVARDAGADTCVSGSLMRLGASKLRVDLHVQDTRTGKILFSDKVESDDINGIFTMVDAMTARLAERALPASQMPASTPQVIEVMTSNLEAMRHYQVALDYFRKAQGDEAIREFEEAVHIDPQFGMAYYYLQYFYVTLGNAAKADETLHILERLQSRLPRVVQLDVEKKRVGAIGDYEGAIRAAEATVREDPRWSEGLVRLAQATVIDQPERAASLARQAVALEPNEPRMYNYLAGIEATAGHEAAALEACDRYQKLLGVNEPNGWDTRADTLFSFGRDEEAAAAYRHALALDSSWGRSAGPFLALILADEGKSELAADELRRYKQHAVGLRAIDLPMFQSQLLQAQGKPEQALALYPGVIRAFSQVGQARNAHRALFTYATLALLLGQERSALVVARQYKFPDHMELITISMLEAAAGNEADAEAALQQFAHAKPETPASVIDQHRDFNDALVALRLSDRGAAPRILANLTAHTAIRLNHRDFLSFFVRARIRMLLKDYQGAEQDFRRAIVLVRNYWSAFFWPTAMPLAEQLSHFYLGQIYEKADKRDGAVREYQKFLTPYAKSTSVLPQIAEARAALKRLHG
jgi:serine/threonine protein kinase/tetratricopeptide (TPR) repeat protein